MTKTTDLNTEVQELAWAMIDEHASDQQVRRLEELLLQSSEARQTYVECMQMHADLYYLLGGKRSKVEKRNKKAATRMQPLEAIGAITSPDVPLCDGSLR
jgi:hypothetical protein